MTSGPILELAPVARPARTVLGPVAVVSHGAVAPVTVRTSPPDFVRAEPGPLLLADLEAGAGLTVHRDRVGAVPTLTAAELLARVDLAAVRGRGGAGFPFAVKLRAVVAARRGPELVVNLAEGEPASAKDSALALYAPHRVLDGAAVTALALGIKRIHVVVGGDRPMVRAAIDTAVAERADAGEGLQWRVADTEPRFVAGQARAVIELLEGRPGLPVTSWSPEARSGLRGRPTLLSNAETWAHVAALASWGSARYAALGTSDEPGTTLLTVTSTAQRSAGDSGDEGCAGTLPNDPPGTAVVVEVEHGTPWAEVLGDRVHDPVLLGGFHGTWVPPGALAGHTVSRAELRAAGLGLGAGVVLTTRHCPLVVTGQLAAYLSDERAGRCGPCVHGLPALASEMGRLAAADPGASYSRLNELSAATGLLTGRGACAHPDGTARLVASVLRAVPDEVAGHLDGQCTWGNR